MSKYEVVIMRYKGSVKGDEKKVEGFITVNGGHETANGFIDRCDIIFNPMEILGNLRYIAEDLCCNEEMIVNISHLPSDIAQRLSNIEMVDKETIVNIFRSPYDVEPCFNNMEIIDKEKYFKLLEEVKKIIYSDMKLSILDVYKLANNFKIPIQFDLDFKEEIDSNELICFKSDNAYGEGDDKLKYEQRDFIYSFRCNDISDIVVAVLTYLILFDYHFYRCKHCKKYSAELRHQKDRRYCMRENVLDILGYEKLSCRDALAQILNLIYTKYRREKKYLKNRIDIQDAFESEQRKSEYEELIRIYEQKKKLINDNPSSENIKMLISYLDSIDRERRKKRK